MHLCINCEDILKAIKYPQKSKSIHEGRAVNCEGVNLGWLDSVIVHSINDTDSYAYHITPEGPQRIYVYLDQSTSLYLSSTGRRLHWYISVTFYIPWRDRPAEVVSAKYAPNFCLAADDINLLDREEEEQENFLLGRVRPQNGPDVEFIRNCYKRCLNVHGDKCSHPRHESFSETYSRVFALPRSDPLPGRLRIIDLEDQCIIESKPRDAPYTVLSYVWGNSNFLTLTTSNCDALMNKGALEHIQKPKTILHAMQAALALDLRYLWIDALCIMQDSEQDKIPLLSSMDEIYAGASITIIAGSATEADEGLWAYQEDQIIEEFGGLRFVAMEPSLLDLLTRSIWFTRGWTYQELVLSRRLLIFSNNQAYFSCGSAAFAADSICRITPDGRRDAEYPDNDTDVSIPVFAEPVLSFPVYWRNLVGEYTKRQLSYQSDGLNAALGVMSAYCRSVKDMLVCGLRVSALFEYGLLWTPMQRLQRREVKDMEPFPSWSWLGWIGQVLYEDHDDGRNFGECQFIQKWQLETVRDSSSRVFLVYEEGAVKLTHQESLGIVHLPMNHMEPNKQVSLIQRGLLCFQTVSAAFKMASICSFQLVSSDDQSCEFTGVYKIFSRDIWVGGIHLEHEVADTLLSANSRDGHEFIVLSEEHYRPWMIALRQDFRHLGDDDESGYVFDRQLLGEDEDNFDVYNVMMIRQHEDTNTATRLGIGQIHLQSFNEAEPISKWVRLE